MCSACPHLNNHNTEECRKLNNLCYKCNEKGHKAVDCRNTSQKNKYDNNHRRRTVESQTHPTANRNRPENNNYNRVNNIQTNNEFPQNPISKFSRVAKRIFKQVTVDNVSVTAMLDTGSDVCLLPKSVYEKLNVELKNHPIEIIGIAQQIMRTIGYIKITAKIDEIKLPLTFHIAKDQDLGNMALLGNDILQTVDINLTAEGATFSIEPFKNDNNEFTLGIEFSSLCTIKTNDTNLIELPENIEQSQKFKLKNLVKNYTPENTVESPIKMKLILTDDIPVFQHPRRMSLPEQEIVKTQINEWLKAGIIRPSTSEYASPIVLAKKKDGSKRLCCDYRKLNEKIIRDNFPMILIDDALLKLEGANIFTTLDLKNGFLHVPIEEESRKYTAFVTDNSQYEFNFVPFGISNSPAVFCRYISTIFHKLILTNKIVVYMDDIIIPSKTTDENLTILAELLNIAEKYDIHINWKKCQFLQNSVKFLGYIVSNSTIKPSSEKINTVLNFVKPKDQKSLQRFLALTSYFRRFIPNYALIAKPLSDMLAKFAKFEFHQEQEIAFEELKTALTNAPILKLYNQNAYTEVHTDACMYGYGAILMQKDSETQQLHPIEYMSRKTSSTEQKYHSYEQEILAIIEAFKKWRCFLLDKKFKLITDCNAFVGTMKKKDVPLRVTRWIMFLQDFNFEVEHRSGTKMRHVDVLSRIYTLCARGTLTEKIIKAQDSVDWMHTAIKMLKNENNPDGDLYVKNNILYKNKNKEWIVIPECLEREIIETAHKQGHYSAKKTSEIVEKSFYIRNLQEKCKTYVENCIQCILAEAKAGKKEGFLNSVPKPNLPLDTLHIDHIGPLETTKKLYNFILTVVDSFTKFTWIYPTRSTSAEETLDKLQKHAAIFGYPKTVVTDRGTAFTSHKFKYYCIENNVHHHLITTGVPRENGQVERINKE